MSLDVRWKDLSIREAIEPLGTLGGVARAPCRNCGRSSGVEELGVASGSFWLYCRICGHLWRRLNPEQDVFSLLLSNRPPPLRVEAGEGPQDGVPRAPRFRVHLEVQYRISGDLDWHIAVTRNVSQSGVLFGAKRAVGLRMPVKIVFILPGSVAGEPATRVRCDGQTVRVELPRVAHEWPAAIAATVKDYVLLLTRSVSPYSAA